ncbi:MAG: Vi polysaccharide biosynthesis protein VipA/TviB [Euryarchaeota archaeon]|nr:Vi polysaccharide biosynthesis protein VipA/TviB [Euryarchaeota archaeon]|tara:strand:+ start:3046 stop:4341 length:1296 start_codon:yes stop_codon:yes gene_type:complete
MKFELSEVKITIVGLGYVGLPLAIEFGKYFSVIGYDLDKKRIDQLQKNYDRTNEINQKTIEASGIKFSSSSSEIQNSNVYIISVPSPVDNNNNPDFEPLKNASKIVGRYLNNGDVVIYESTVFPGATEEIFVPILSSESGMEYNSEFFCGYSPERINPGDKNHTITKIKKITSGSTPEISKFVDSLYSMIIVAGTHNVSSIAIAEAAKVIENTQRDVNIALINELAIIFNKLEIDTTEVLEAAETKWNFIPFRPGLVGGHCIGVDPYYLVHKAVEVGYHPEILLAGRRINDNMGRFIAENTIIEMAKRGKNPLNAKIGILGLTFKENCPDLRNSKVVSIVEYLREYKCHITISDEWADHKEAKDLYDIDLDEIESMANLDAVIIAVKHSRYYQIDIKMWESILNESGVIIDVKSIYSEDTFSSTNLGHWKL